MKKLTEKHFQSRFLTLKKLVYKITLNFLRLESSPKKKERQKQTKNPTIITISIDKNFISLFFFACWLEKNANKHTKPNAPSVQEKVEKCTCHPIVALIWFDQNVSFYFLFFYVCGAQASFAIDYFCPKLSWCLLSASLTNELCAVNTKLCRAVASLLYNTLWSYIWRMKLSILVILEKSADVLMWRASISFKLLEKIQFSGLKINTQRIILFMGKGSKDREYYFPSLSF